jgi:hypothetical protein
MAVKIGKSEVASSSNGLVVERRQVADEKKEQCTVADELSVEPVVDVDVSLRDVSDDEKKKVVRSSSRRKSKKVKE